MSPTSNPESENIQSLAVKLHWKQATFLRQEIVELVAESRKLEIYALGALGALYAWLYSNEPSDTWSWYVPPVLAFLGGMRSVALYYRIGDIARYLRGFEQKFLPDVPEKHSPKADPAALIGWERHIQANPSSPFVTTAVLFWSVAILSGAALACYHHSPYRVREAKQQNAIKVEGSLEMRSVGNPPIR